MDKQCENCSYWVKPEISNYEIEQNDPEMHHGNCLAAKFHDGCIGTDEEDSIIRAAPMIVMDGSGYMAKLKTKAAHYCNEWAESQPNINES